MGIRGKLIVGAIVGMSCTGAPARAGPLARTGSPIILLGARLAPFDGVEPDELVAFRFQDDWLQIPVQVDERMYVDYGVVYRVPPTGLGVMAYADSTTDVGPDNDPAFDEDDELVFMADDAGDRAPVGAAQPAGVVPDSGVEIEITDPLDGGGGYVYLFQTDGTLVPDAGEDYVTYTFYLLAGDYLTHYDTQQGPNLEDSEVFSDHYRTHFSERWIRDELNIFAGNASGVDVLDRHKTLFGPGVCERSEDTFSAGEGAFFTNRDGPVRAIRSYVGANSGPFTQREHHFYRQRHDIITYLRVHAIPGIMDLYDYSPAAAGMTYYNDWNIDGAPVDGWPDDVIAGPIVWEMVGGGQGSLVITHRVETDITSFAYESFHSDDATPYWEQCTGDAFEYATSGVWIDDAIPNTDPYWGAFNTLASRRVVFFEPPDQPVALAALRFEQVSAPLEVALRGYPRYKGDSDGNCYIDLLDYAAFSDCLSGPRQGAAAGCDVFDWNGDCDVDFEDYRSFSMAFTGPDEMIPGCEL